MPPFLFRDIILMGRNRMSELFYVSGCLQSRKPMRAQGFQRDSERVPTLAKCRGIRAALLKAPIFGWGFLLGKQRVA